MNNPIIIDLFLCNILQACGKQNNLPEPIFAAITDSYRTAIRGNRLNNLARVKQSRIKKKRKSSIFSR